MSITLLLPIRIDPYSNFSDLDRFELFGMPSFRKFLPPSLVHELLVVAPSEDLGTIRSRLGDLCPFPLRLLDDSAICPAINEEKGWYKQQIIKIAAAKHITTKWYLTIDSDVVCTRAIDENFFFTDGRAIWQQEPASNFPEWWEGSRDVLKAARTPTGDEMVMGVTPALMHTESTLSLIAKISSCHSPDDWTKALVKLKDKRWTEYSLYWTHLLAKDAVADLYISSDRLLYSKASVWHSHQAVSLDSNLVSKIFSDEANHAFFVFQSRAGVSLMEIAAKIRPCLGMSGKLPLSIRLRILARMTRVRLRRLHHLLSEHMLRVLSSRNHARTQNPRTTL